MRNKSGLSQGELSRRFEEMTREPGVLVMLVSSLIRPNVHEYVCFAHVHNNYDIRVIGYRTSKKGNLGFGPLNKTTNNCYPFF